MFHTPSEADIQKVMNETGMERMQAINRLRGQAALRNRPQPFPLGRNQSIDHDAEYAIWAAKYPEQAARHAAR